MGLGCYLAMTAAEIQNAQALPQRIAWMACHFSGHSTGLSNLPSSLPTGSLLILNDRIPFCGHDPVIIAQQLNKLTEELSPTGVLLDFERPEEPDLAQLAAHLTGELLCPVVVSWLYAKELDCPVFLPPPPLHTPLQEHLQAWEGRSVWLELAMQTQVATVTSRGCSTEDAHPADLAEPNFYDKDCCCRYRWELSEDAAVFTMSRQYPELILLEEKAKQLGVAETIGLYQQLE